MLYCRCRSSINTHNHNYINIKQIQYIPTYFATDTITQPHKLANKVNIVNYIELTELPSRFTPLCRFLDFFIGVTFAGEEETASLAGVTTVFIGATLAGEVSSTSLNHASLLNSGDIHLALACFFNSLSIKNIRKEKQNKNYGLTWTRHL